MSDYANKLAMLTEKKNKLLEDEQKLIKQRKAEIGEMAQSMGLLSVSDDILAGLFDFGKHAIAEKSQQVKEWETVGARFRQSSKKVQSGKNSPSKKNISTVNKSKSAAEPA